MPTWSFQDSKWRQGAVIPRVLIPDTVLPPDLDQQVKPIIISHDCDIVQPSYEAEPFVEFLLAKPLPEEQKDGTLFRGRNSRKLQFRAPLGEDLQLYEISALDRFRIERLRLEFQQPDLSIKLDDPTIATLARWFSKRYKRSSFPSTFNRRISDKTWKKIKTALKRHGDDVLLFLGLNSMNELSPDNTYQVLVRVVVPREAIDNDLREQNALAVVASLRTHLSQCPGIEVVDIGLESEAEFSLEDYLYNTVEWDTLDYLSVPSDEPDGPQ